MTASPACRDCVRLTQGRQQELSVLAAVACHAASNVGWSLFPDHGSHYDPVVTGSVAAAVALLVMTAWPRTSSR
ncbi:UNVERIFIED_ORG: hypothetical protein FHR35_007273 [Microbispora rosea subsp. rosea]